MKIWFAHAMDARNSGDMGSVPYTYFKEYFDNFNCVRIDITRLEEYPEKVKRVIEQK